MIAPDFWKSGRGGVRSTLLTPVGVIVSLVTYIRQSIVTPWKAQVPVLCIGNVVVGGAGKTPVAISIGKAFKKNNVNINYLSRGYGGYDSGPHLVNLKKDTSHRVGDEPLLLSKVAPTWVSRNRVQGAKTAIANNAKLILMDDGLQHHRIHKVFSILVVDVKYGFGNGKIMPAGPLREPLSRALKRVNLVVLIGENSLKVRLQLLSLDPKLIILNAKLIPGPEIKDLENIQIVAFSGIGQPEKFFTTLEENGCKVIYKGKYPDHHQYSSSEICALKARAKKNKGILVTTEKDWVRLSKDQRLNIKFLTVNLEWEDENALNLALNRFY